MRKVFYVLENGKKETDYQKVLASGQRYKQVVEDIIDPPVRYKKSSKK